MAWKPPTQKAFDAGEIPHKKIISDEEQAHLDANRPSKDVHAMFGGDPNDIVKQIENVSDAQQERLDQLLPVGNGQAISDFLEKLQNSKAFGVAAAVLEPNFETEMIMEVGSSGKSFLVSEVLKIAYLKEHQEDFLTASSNR